VKEIIEKLARAPGWVRRSTSGAYILAITILSMIPARTFEEIPSLFDNMDKPAHALMYGGMAALLCWTFRIGQRKTFLYYSVIFLFCAGYGILMETIQAALSNLDRNFSWGDALANIVGIAVFIPLKERIIPSSLDSQEQA